MRLGSHSATAVYEMVEEMTGKSARVARRIVRRWLADGADVDAALQRMALETESPAERASE